MKAYLLQESLERLWTYTYEGAMLRYLKSWTLQLRWQRLPAFEKLAWISTEGHLHKEFAPTYSQLGRASAFGLAVP
jgi:hypothetical protein